MEIAPAQTYIYNSGFSAELLENRAFLIEGGANAAELAYELGLWLSSLETFLNAADPSFVDNDRLKDAEHNWIKEFRLTNSALLLCAKLNFRLRKALALPENVRTKITIADSDELLLVLRDAIILNGGFLRAERMKFEEWKAWCAMLTERLFGSLVFEKFVAYAERSGEDFLPQNLQKLLLRDPSLPLADEADLNVILPRFAGILRSLGVIGGMLRNDDPLKPTLLIFSHIYEQTQELISFINNRLAHFSDEEADLFGSLDAASYTASLELKKVYNQELIGLVGVRPPPSVYARIETAYALLSDSFQQILAGFARLREPDISITELFPNFKIKLEQSLGLREQLWSVLQAAKAAEQRPEKQPIDELKTELTVLMEVQISFLFFKDKETLERFNEEIRATGSRKDLVPILHRFGAYVETLFGQVNMRNVLTNHPFEAPKN